MLRNFIDRLTNKNVLFVSVTTVVFTLGFYLNFWGTAEHERFVSFDTYCESQVIGRVIKAEKDGIFSHGGFNGWVLNGLEENYDTPRRNSYQFEIYEKELDVDVSEFSPYLSQTGGQAIFFAFLDRISPFKNSTNLKLFHLLAAFSMAIVLSFFVFWIIQNYDRFSAFIFSFFIVTSPWLTVYGNAIYWVLAVFFIPFVVLMISLQKESNGKVPRTFGRLYLLAVSLFFLKLFMTGYEFITTALIMITIPLFYFAFIDQWKPKLFLQRFVAISAGATSAIFLYIMLFLTQVASVKGGFLSGMKQMLYSFSKRTHGDSTDFNLPEIYKNSMDASIAEVLNKYWNATAIDLNIWIKSDFESIFTIDFGDLILFFLIFTALSFVSNTISPSTFRNRRRNAALSLTTWLSLLAPLSWFVIFKAHSYIHSSYNSITWYMPFALLGFLLVGSVTSSCLKDAVASIRALSKQKRRIAFIGAISVFCFLFYISVSYWIHDYVIYRKVSKEQNMLCQTGGFDVYIYDGQLWYINETPADLDKKTRFFLHIRPIKVDDLPEKRKQYKFDNLDFSVKKNQIVRLPKWSGKDEFLILFHQLPGYAIDEIRTGQYIGKEIIWDTKFLNINHKEDNPYLSK